ncbi:transposase is4 [Holotrichia oblita]|uniref:Transposase is4 n=1 Tax=Holotrichia oblita TaxID=644536 RepID=A0ACB9SSH5_HOLOL|nr:transposase is4 [Holotrichia oblita]
MVSTRLGSPGGEEERDKNNDRRKRHEEERMFAPINACGNLTDEDSGEDDIVQIDNLPGSQVCTLTDRCTYQHLNKKVMENGRVEQKHSVDEPMVSYYGRHGPKQFLNGKPIRCGYKLWVGSSRLGYVYWLEPYQGISTNISTTYADYGIGASVVLEYADALRRKWPEIKFHLFFDNFFTSVNLVQLLAEENKRKPFI